MVHGQLIAGGQVKQLTYNQLRALEKLDAKKERDTALYRIAEQIPKAAGDAIAGGFLAIGQIVNGYLNGDAIAFAEKSAAGLVFWAWFVTSFPQLAHQLHLDLLRWPGDHTPPPPPPDIPGDAKGGVNPLSGQPDLTTPDPAYSFGVTYRYYNPFDGAYDLNGQEWFRTAAARQDWINKQGNRIQVTGYESS